MEIVKTKRENTSEFNRRDELNFEKLRREKFEKIPRRDKYFF